MMKRMLNLCVALLATYVMVSCTEKRDFGILNGEWNVVSVGELVVPDSADVFMGFNIAEQLVYGNTGCNYLTGFFPLDTDSSTPLFSTIGSTRKWCADMTIENAMIPALIDVVDFKVEGDTLCLLNAEGATMLTLVKR